MLLGFALRLLRGGRDPDDARQAAAWGGQIALATTLAQIPVGLWLAATLESQLQNAVSGNDLLATSLLLGSIALAVWMMAVLAGISIGDAERKNLLKAMVLMVVVVAMMSGVLQRLRLLRADRSPSLKPAARARGANQRGRSLVCRLSLRERSGPLACASGCNAECRSLHSSGKPCRQ
jgi:hypothetical protein